MDYGRVLGRAWQITWRWKVLWILGFLASLGQGGSSLGNSSQYSGSEGDFGNFQMPDWAIGAIIAVACLALLVGIALWVVSIIARGGLIAGVQQVEDEGSTRFGDAWRAGRSRFWTLFGITVLTAVPILIFLLIVAILVGLTIAGAGVGSSMDQDVAGWLAASPWLICGLPLCCGFIIVMFLVSLIQTYADRAAMLEGLGWIDAFRRGWAVIRAHPGPTLLLWLIFLVIGLVIGAIVLAVTLPVILPLVALLSRSDLGGWVLVPICGGGLIAIVLGSILNAVIQTFTSATWTLAYRELTAAPTPPPPAALEL